MICCKTFVSYLPVFLLLQHLFIYFIRQINLVLQIFCIVMSSYFSSLTEKEVGCEPTFNLIFSLYGSAMIMLHFQIFIYLEFKGKSWNSYGRVKGFKFLSNFIVPNFDLMPYLLCRAKAHLVESQKKPKNYLCEEIESILQRMNEERYKKDWMPLSVGGGGGGGVKRAE